VNRLIPTKSPALPLAEQTYTAAFKNRYSNILRLYFTQLDGLLQALLGDNGSKYLQTPHISAADTSDQYALGNNTPTLVVFNVLESISGFTLDPTGYAVAGQDGVYKIDYSLQAVNTDNASHDVYIWLQVNGDFVSNSSSRFTVPARKSAGVYGYTVAYSSIEFEIAKDDEIRLWWAPEKAYNVVGPVAGVYLEALPAQTLPYVRPANPSAVGSINYISRLP